MSKGLGHIERRVLEELEKINGWDGIRGLANKIYHGGRKGEGRYYHTHSQYMSVYRAISSLKRKGLVKTRRLTYSRKGGRIVHLIVALASRKPLIVIKL